MVVASLVSSWWLDHAKLRDRIGRLQKLNPNVDTLEAREFENIKLRAQVNSLRQENKELEQNVRTLRARYFAEEPESLEARKKGSAVVSDKIQTLHRP